MVVTYREPWSFCYPETFSNVSLKMYWHDMSVVVDSQGLKLYACFQPPPFELTT